MKELYILLSPMFLSIKNDLLSFNRQFYKKIFLYAISGVFFIFLITKLLSFGIMKLQNLSSEVFTVLFVKGYSLIFLIIFIILVIDGFVLSFNRFYQSRVLELLFISPVNRLSLFFSKLIETHLKTSWMVIIFGIPLLVSLGIQYKANPVFYVYSFVMLAVFSTIPVNIGVGIAIIASGIFNLKKLRKFLFSAGIVAVIGVITLLRIFKPERFVNPELFANLKIFLSEMRTSSFILLPSRWFSESLFNYINNNYGYSLLFAAMIFLTSYISVFFLILVYKKYHYRGWNLLQGGDISASQKRTPVFSAVRAAIKGNMPILLQRIFFRFENQSGTLFRKDFLYQIHDVKNIQHYLVLLSLVIVYLYSLASLPLDWEGYAVKLKYIISYVNLGLILIIITSLCSKLVYPAIVSEGDSLWIIKTAPVTSQRYIWTKFFFLFIPIFILGEVLTVFSSFFVDIDLPIFILNVFTVLLLCFSLVSMAVLFSIADLKNATKGGTGEEIKTGNTIYMIVSVIFIIFTLAIEAIPIYLYFLQELEKTVFTQKAWYIIGTVVFVLVLVNSLVTLAAIRLSVRRFDEIQLS
jgi:hypothetical protein